MKPWLVLIGGPPASGKSTIARALAQELSLPCFTKDLFKEVLFDTLGYGDRERSMAYGRAAYALMYTTAKELLRAGVSLILESNFRTGLAEPELSALQTRVACALLQVYCEAPLEVLIERFRARWKNGDRHPGHVDGQTVDAVFANVAASAYTPLDLPAPLVRVDTTWPLDLALQTVVRQVRAALGAQPPI